MLYRFPISMLFLLSTIALGAAINVRGKDEWDPLRKLIEDYDIIPDCVVTVGDQDGLLFSYSKGRTNPRTQMPIASSTKWIAGVAIMSVVADKSVPGLELDTKAADLLPFWTKDPSDLRSTVTLRQMLGFVSGFEGGDNCGTRDFMQCAEHTYNTARLTTPPGTAMEYNSIHLRFAGAMAVAATRTPMDEIVRERVFLPARMVNTVWSNDANPELSGGLSSTAEDYDRFLHGYFSESLIPASARTAMETDQYPDASFGGYALFMGHYGLANWFECLLYLGVWRPECDRASIHTSPGIYGWYPVVDRTNKYYFQIAFAGGAVVGPAESAYMRLAIKPTIDAIIAGAPPPPTDVMHGAVAGVAQLTTEFARLFAADQASSNYFNASNTSTD